MNPFLFTERFVVRHRRETWTSEGTILVTIVSAIVADRSQPQQSWTAQPDHAFGA